VQHGDANNGTLQGAAAQPVAGPTSGAAAKASAPVAPLAVAPTGVATTPVATVAVARPKPAAKPGDGHITVASEPRCEVLVDGVPYGQTPLIDLAVPAGRHNVTLLNSAAGVRENVKIALRENELWTRSFSFDGGKMAMQNGLSQKMLTQAPSEKKAEAPVRADMPAAHVAAKPVAAPTPTAAVTPPPSAPRAIEGTASKPAAPAPAPVASMVPASKPKNVAARTLDSQQLSHAEPHLPDIVRIQRRGTGDARFSAKVCINNDGKVYQVAVISGIPGGDDQIINTIKQWTYKPQPVSVCSVVNLVFDLQ
jgi:hypothetical protein